ncbi:TPA: hypothetical protein N0F65_001846 [Lagenidium giganteum]|uniref:26S proteasome regulatory subunit RPN1 n=1 Tax=Lagenidium giganteum TaxID=4803 RepID=A0AAV2YLM9_9STRA|nr:TPA: hypothetical protein N0F65_001846 [Lagenidium giganteum]
MKEAAQIKVTSTDPEGKKKEDANVKPENPAEDGPKDEDLSEEDRKLKEDLETAVRRVCDPAESEGVKKLALELLRREIRTATSSMTSVPKPLKFLRPSYNDLKTVFEGLQKGDVKTELADILAVLAMTMAKEGSRESLKFKLMGNSTDLGSWGHEFVRSIAGEVGEEYNARLTAETEGEADVAELLAIVDAIVPFHMQHNAEPEAIDILIEVQQLSKLLESKEIDEKNYQRVCLYLLACSDYMSDPDDLLNLLNTAYHIFLRVEQYPDALRVALRLGNEDFVADVFQQCKNPVTRKQLGYILGRQRFFFEDENDSSVNDMISNADLSDKFLSLARDLDVMEAKTPEDIYKSHLSETASIARNRDSGAQPTDSARHNLASTFVNAFVNAGYGADKLMTPEGNTWLYKNKKHGMMSAAASLGMIMLWNVEEGITQIDKYLYSGDEYVKAGAILGVGIVSAGIRNECDPALALLSENIDDGNGSVRCASCLGLGIAYAGSAREDVSELLIPVVSHADENADIQEVAFAALALGMVEVGTCDDVAGGVLMQRLMESSDVELDSSCVRFLALGLGLLYLGRQERVDAMLEAVKTIEHRISKYLAITLETCAYAGTGNVLKVQQLLRICAEHIEDPLAAQHQSVAVIGIALITMGENIGSEMAIRSFDHLLQYGEVGVRRAVPLALALLSVSNPEYSLIDTLSRLTHDADAGVAQNAILALGLVAAGTNNSRVAGLLRQLSEFYHREANHLFVVRIAQGLLHMGKGLMTLHPFHSDRLIMSRVAVSGILAVLHASLDMEHTILDTSHFILYTIATAMQPRMLITLDEELNPLPVSVRVGQAVEIVGQAGRPKSITGFQTHTTPVLLNVKDRAELATDEYLPHTNVLEGVVILRKNPDFKPETERRGHIQRSVDALAQRHLSEGTMSQPVPFHNPNAPYQGGQNQQRQRPTAHHANQGFSFGNPHAGAPQFNAQPAAPQQPQRPQQPQPFYQGQQQETFYTPPAQTPAAPQDYQQPASHGFGQPQQAFHRQPQQAQSQPQQPGFGFAQGGGQQQQQPRPARPQHPNFLQQHQQQQQQRQQQQPDFFNDISQNPMAGLAMNTAQDFLQKQSQIYMPGAYGVWGSLKYYFTVNNSYVKNRLKMLLLPFWHKNWRRVGPSEHDESKMTQFAPPSRDVNAPDLYIPLMGFLTYILIVGYTKGTSNQFSPDVIGKDASYCLVMQLVEIGIFAACLYLLNSSISFLDLVSFSGYKYVPLVINTVVFQLAGPIAYYVALLYTGVAVSYFTLNCMKGSVAEPTPENRTFRNYVLFGVSCLQLVLVSWISYTTSPHEQMKSTRT